MVRLREDLRLRSDLVLLQCPLRFVFEVKHRLLHLPTLTDVNWRVYSEKHFAQAFYFALLWTLILAPYSLQELKNLVTGKTTANLSRGRYFERAALLRSDLLDLQTEESVSLSLNLCLTALAETLTAD